MGADKSIRTELHDILAREPETAARYWDTSGFTGCIKHHHCIVSCKTLNVTLECLALYSHRHRDWLLSVESTFYSSVPPGKYQDSTLSRSQPLLPHPFEIIIYWSSYHLTQHYLSYWNLRQNKLK
jgi:hypothetical protein